MAEWRTVDCHECGGRGLVMHYSGVDPVGADPCDLCSGSGRIFASEGGALALWPGGPFCGFDRSAFAKGIPWNPDGDWSTDDLLEELGHELIATWGDLD